LLQEGQPHCQRCIKAKRPCHYGGDETHDDPVKFILYAAPKEATPFPGLTQAERRALYHFQHRTAEELPGPFRSELWSTTIMQAAQTQPAVRHAVFALASMHQYYAGTQSLQGEYDFSMHHYNKSIRQALRLTDPSESFESLLLTSVMFSALDGMKGEYEQSLQHALSGLKIITRGRQGLSEESQAVPDQTLPSIFLSLQTQAMDLEDRSVFKEYPDLDDKFPPLPTHFNDAEQAMEQLQILVNHLATLEDHYSEAWRCATLPPAVVPDHLFPSYVVLKERFHRWSAAFEHLALFDTRVEASQHKAYLLMKIYQTAMAIVFKSFDTNNPSFDAFASDLSSMLGLIEVFLQSQNTSDTLPPSESITSASTAKTYSVSFGVVHLLFKIGHRSTDPALIEEAQRLLRSCDRREGIWDSKDAASLLERLILLRQDVTSSINSDGLSHRVYITKIGPSAGAGIPFQYAIMPMQGTMYAFWFSSFKLPHDTPTFESKP
jgi:hypothetical protein